MGLTRAPALCHPRQSSKRQGLSPPLSCYSSNINFEWWARQESDLQSPGCDPGVLPLNYAPNGGAWRSRSSHLTVPTVFETVPKSLSVHAPLSNPFQLISQTNPMLRNKRITNFLNIFSNNLWTPVRIPKVPNTIRIFRRREISIIIIQ